MEFCTNHVSPLTVSVVSFKFELA